MFSIGQHSLYRMDIILIKGRSIVEFKKILWFGKRFQWPITQLSRSRPDKFKCHYNLGPVWTNGNPLNWKCAIWSGFSKIRMFGVEIMTVQWLILIGLFISDKVIRLSIITYLNSCYVCKTDARWYNFVRLSQIYSTHVSFCDTHAC